MKLQQLKQTNLVNRVCISTKKSKRKSPLNNKEMEHVEPVQINICQSNN